MNSQIVILIITFISMMISSYLFIKSYISHRSNFILLMMISWIAFSFFWIITSFNFISFNTILFYISQILLSITFISIVLGIDYLFNDRIGSIKLVISSILNSLMIYNLFTGSILNGVIINENYVVYEINFLHLWIVTFAGLFSGIIIYAYLVKILISCPPSLKKSASLNIIGITFIVPITAIIFISGVNFLIPGIGGLLSSFGMLLISYVFYHHPKLIFVLPFKVIKLDIIQIDTGISVYTYNWNNHNINNDLYSSVIEGIRSFADNVVGSGDVKEIILDSRMMIIKYNSESNYYFVLLTTKKSNMITSSLDKFAYDFQNQFGSINNNFIDTSEFSSTIILIEKHFSFIPKYI